MKVLMQYFYIWEHMYPEQIDSLLDEFYRILKKKGRDDSPYKPK